MPTYEFVCPDCGAMLEIRKSYSDMSYRPMCLDCKTLMTRRYSIAQICVPKKRPHGFYPPERLEINR